MSESLKLHPSSDKAVNIDQLQLVSPTFLNGQREGARNLLSDLRPYLNRIDLFEDMFTPAVTGQIYLRDTISITNIAPLLGLEQLWLKFSNTDKTTRNRRAYGPYPFAVYSQEHRSPVAKGAEEYVLNLASPELITSLSRKISFSFNDKPEDIIDKIVREPYGLASKKALEKQSTKSKIKMVVPYMSPLEVIKLVTLQGQSADNEANYVFFETLDGYYYVSFQELLRRASVDPNIPTIYLDLAGYRDMGDTPLRIKAEQLQVTLGFDMMYGLARGYFASVTYAPDVLSGVCGVEYSGIGWGGAYDKRVKVNPNGLDLYPPELGLATSPTSRIFLVPTTAFSAANTQLTGKDTSITDNFIAQTIDGRNRELLGLQTRTIRGRVAGAPELHAGKIINVQFPTTLNNQKGAQELQDIASGRYIIINAKHSIVPDGRAGFLYETVFEAVTDSFASS